ncbi:MAG: hypothetical protein IJU04_02195 [Ruminococcus sp.]|nr:hypothetical protein [Ruminococcus sp.]
MLLYEYPPKLDVYGKQQKAVHDLSEHKKMRKNMYKNLILAAVIFAIGFFANILIIKIVLWLIAVGNALTALLLYNVSALSRDTKLYTKIYDDRLEHCQGYALSKKHTYIVLYYSDIVKSYQNNHGDLIVTLKDGYQSTAVTESKNGNVDAIQDNTIKLKFQDTKAKLYLIENLYEQIKYPHKEYNVIEDDEDEDDLWDPLHKHGL